MRYGCANAVDPRRLGPRQANVRARFVTAALFALDAVVVGALGIAVTLATSDSAKWPAWLRPYHHWDWWAVLVLLVVAAILAVWQFTRQPHGHLLMPKATSMHVSTDSSSGPVAGRSPAGANGTSRRPPAPVSNLPARNLAFTGRTDLLDRLHQQLTNAPVGTPGSAAAIAVTALASGGPEHDGTTSEADAGQSDAGTAAAPRVLHGLGGVGKTQLALEYAHRHTTDYAIRWWVPAERPAATPTHLAALAHQLGIPEHADQAETVTALLNELGRRDDWLLVFDNAEDPHDLHPYWPTPSGNHRGGRVLVTSRNPNWQPLAATMPIDVLPRPEAIAFLQRRAGIHEPHADALAEALGDLPLALEQAAAYLEQTQTPPEEYLELLGARSRELFALGRPATSEQTVATIWTVSLRRLEQEAPAAQDLLNLCAFLAPDDIPRSLLAAHSELLPDRLSAAVKDRVALQRADGALRRYSLVTLDGDAVSLHRLVQAVTRHTLTLEQTRTWAAAAVRVVRAAFPQAPANVDLDTWPTSARLLPHALAATDHASGVEADPAAAASLLNDAGLYLWTRAEHQQAKALLERALHIREAHLGADHPETGYSLGSLATVLRRVGDLTTARKFHERSLAIRQAHLGPDDPDIAYSLNNLGNVLRDLGDLQSARRLYERALAIRQTQLGPDHRTVATSLDNLGNVLRRLGHLHTAREHHERALKIWQTQVGPNHPDTATSLHNLGIVLRELGHPDDARTLQERALAIREARLGPEHPAIAQA
jgi:tetratricopeptide (TPR) repeat protein